MEPKNCQNSQILILCNNNLQFDGDFTAAFRRVSSLILLMFRIVIIIHGVSFKFKLSSGFRLPISVGVSLLGTRHSVVISPIRIGGHFDREECALFSFFFCVCFADNLVSMIFLLVSLVV